jgi:uncharacterized protein YeaO (DUF488 family)
MIFAMIKVKRVYEPPQPEDGFRVLVDRLWPRGIRKEDARIDLWLKDVSPSADLRRWFHHDPARWDELLRRYRGELAERPEALAMLRDKAACGTVTLVYAAREREHNNAVALATILDE